MSLLSVTIPNRNRGSSVVALLQSLDSLVRSTDGMTAEVFVVDDGSTDDSVSAVRSAAPDLTALVIEVIPHAQPLGAAASRNEGIARSRGDLLLFLDSDVRVEPAALRTLTEAIGDADFAFAKILCDDGTVLCPANEFEEAHCLNSAAFLIRRAVLARMDMLFDEFMRIYGEDSDFFLRAGYLGLRGRYVPAAVVGHPVRNTYSAEAFYQGTQNGVYVILKLCGIVPYRVPWIPYLFAHLGLNLVIALTRRHFHKLRLCRITYAAPRRRLLWLYAKALITVAAEVPAIFRRRQALRAARRAICGAGAGSGCAGRV